MLYFSYNDFVDCAENGKIEEITKVSENISKYEQINGIYDEQKDEKQLIEILKDKIQLKKFLNEFFNLKETENITYCDMYKARKEKNLVICKIKEKEIYIIVKIIKNIDYNISYKMFECSYDIIKKWNEEQKMQNKRYPIVIPIVIYLGNKVWRNSYSKVYNKINYIIYEDNKINFSYNIIQLQELKFKQLNKMTSEIAKELACIKNKYLQIN